MMENLAIFEGFFRMKAHHLNTKIYQQIMKKFLIAIAILFFPLFADAQGTLDVLVQDRTPSVLPRNGVSIPFLTLNATATDADIILKGFTVRREGLSESKDVSYVRALAYPRYYSYRSRMGTSDTARIEFGSGGLVIPEGTSQVIQVLADLNDAPVGRTIRLVLEEILSSAESVQIHGEEDIIPEVETPEPVLFQKPDPEETRSFRIECKNALCKRVYLIDDPNKSTFKDLPDTQTEDATTESDTTEKSQPITPLSKNFRIRCINRKCVRVPIEY